METEDAASGNHGEDSNQTEDAEKQEVRHAGDTNTNCIQEMGWYSFWGETTLFPLMHVIN